MTAGKDATLQRVLASASEESESGLERRLLPADVVMQLLFIQIATEIDEWYSFNLTLTFLFC